MDTHRPIPPKPVPATHPAERDGIFATPLTESCPSCTCPRPRSCRRTIRISCRGRLQDLHVARNQDGGPGQLHPWVLPTPTPRRRSPSALNFMTPAASSSDGSLSEQAA